MTDRQRDILICIIAKWYWVTNRRQYNYYDELLWTSFSLAFKQSICVSNKWNFLMQLQRFRLQWNRNSLILCFSQSQRPLPTGIWHLHIFPSSDFSFWTFSSHPSNPSQPTDRIELNYFFNYWKKSESNEFTNEIKMIDWSDTGTSREIIIQIYWLFRFTNQN